MDNATSSPTLPRDGWQQALYFSGLGSFLCVLWAAALYFVRAADGWNKSDEIALFALFFLAVPLAALAGAVLRNQTAEKLSLWQGYRWLNWAALLVPLVLVILGMKGLRVTLYHVQYETPAFSTTRFAVGCAVGLALYAGLVLSKFVQFGGRRWAAVAPRLGVWVGTLLVLSMFDINITLDTLSYDPYVGPAAMVLKGDVPLLDVFSQYGLNYMLFALALWIVPGSMFVTSLIVATLNIVYYLLICAICVRLSYNKLFSFLVIVGAVLFLHSSSLYNVTYTPSVLAMRFLPPVLLLYALLRLPEGRQANIWTVLSGALCTLWAAEAALLGGLVYLGYLSLPLLEQKAAGIRPFLRGCGLLVAVMVGPHLALTLGYLLAFGQAPDYAVYVELLTGQGTTQAGWQVEVDRAIRTWLIFGLGYGLALAWPIYRAWVDGASSDAALRLGRRGLALVAVIGVGQLTYYVGRSVTPVLVFIAFPLAILFTLVLDRSYKSLHDGGRRAVMPAMVLGMGVLILAAMAGVFGDRLYRPVTTVGSNSTFLRVCLPPDVQRNCSPFRIVRTFAAKMKFPQSFPPDESGGWSTNAENKAAYALLQKWQPEKASALLFVMDTAAVLFLTDKVHRLGTAHSMVDGLAPTLASRTLAKLDGIEAGEVVILGDTSRSPLDQTIVERLKASWQFCLLETIAPVSAYRLQPLGASCPEQPTP